MDSAAADPSGGDALSDIISKRLPATGDELGFEWPAEPIATTRAERAALVLGGIRATAIAELAATWTLVEVRENHVDVDLAVVACDRDRCEVSSLIRLVAPYQYPGPSHEAVVTRFETRGPELWLELELDFSTEWRDVEGCDEDDPREDDPHDEECIRPIWGTDTWAGHAVFVRRFDDVIMGWSARLDFSGVSLGVSFNVNLDEPLGMTGDDGKFWGMHLGATIPFGRP